MTARQLPAMAARSAALAAPLAAALLSSCATAQLNVLPSGQLPRCPPAPHCVSSVDPDERHHADAFLIRPGVADPWPQVVKAVTASARTTVVYHNDRYLHATVLSPWHLFTDDLELMLDAPAGRIDVRSSSRVGYYDFHVNRDRVEALRRTLIDAGVLVPAGYP